MKQYNNPEEWKAEIEKSPHLLIDKGDTLVFKEHKDGVIAADAHTYRGNFVMLGRYFSEKFSDKSLHNKGWVQQ